VGCGIMDRTGVVQADFCEYYDDPVINFATERIFVC
jgi:hypothetical protein